MYEKVSLRPEENDAYEDLIGSNFLFPQLCRIEPSSYFVTEALDLEAINNFEIFDDDIFIITPPKSGTTWMQEIVWLLKNQINVQKSKVTNQFYRIPFLELNSVRPTQLSFQERFPNIKRYPDPNLELSNENLDWFMAHSIEFARRMARPRIIKSHLPLWVLPDDLFKKAKVIFVAREPKDQAVSWFYHHKLSSPDLDFERFISRIRNGDPVLYTPIMPMITDAWKRFQENPNQLFFTTFDRMKESLDDILKDLCAFLDVKYEDSELEVLKKAVTLSAFKRNP